MIGACQIVSVSSGFFINAYEGSGMITIGGNISPSASVPRLTAFCKIKTLQEFINRNKSVLFRGVFHSHQSGIYVDFLDDGHTIQFSAEQTSSFSQGDTLSFSLPVIWKF